MTPEIANDSPDESARLANLHDYAILDTAPSESFDRLCRLAARMLGAPMAAVALVDAERQWFKASVGLEIKQTSRAVAFCARAIETDRLLVVPNALKDTRFATNPLVLEAPEIRFYAGVPLTTPEGFRIGTLSVLDSRPRELSPDEEEQLRDLAALAVDALVLHRRTVVAERENAARERRLEQLRNIVAAAPAAIVTSTREGIVTSWNSAAEHIFGWSAEETLGKPLPWVPAGEEEFSKGFRARVWDGQVQRLIDIERVTKDGTRCDISTSAARFGAGPSDDGDGFIFIMQDVSESRRAARLLAASERQFRELADALPEPLIVHRRFQVLYANSAATRVLGEPEGGWRGAAVVRLIPPDSVATVAERADSVLIRGTGSAPWLTELTNLKGEKIQIEAQAIRVSFEGEPAVLAVLRDLTAQNRLREQMVAADRMASIGVLSAGIVHEVKNPLAYVLSNLQFAIEEAEAAGLAEIAEAARDARVGAERILSIVDDIKRFSHVGGAGGVELDLARVIEGAARIAGTQLKSVGGVERTYRHTRRAYGDEGKLGQVVLNLLVNAAHAMEGITRDTPHRVWVETQDCEEGVRIDVGDTGSGMDAATLAHLFEPFFTTKPVGVGTGLGLYICRTLVQAMQGTLRVSSQPGQGTVFSVILSSEPIQRT